MASLANQDWALCKEDMENGTFKNATGAQERNPMYAFVHEHLMSILQPFADHVRELEKQVRTVRDEQLAQSVTMGGLTSAQKALEEVSMFVKKDLGEAKANIMRSHLDVTKLIDVFSQANQERQENLRKHIDEEILDVRSTLQTLVQQQEATFSRLDSLDSKAQVATDQLKSDALHLQHLQEACDLNKFCFHGLSDRLEVTKTQGEATQSELQRLKTVESCHHQEAMDTITKLTRRLDHTDTKVKHNHDDITRMASALGVRLTSAETGLSHVQEAIAALDANMQATLMQYDTQQANEETAQMSALERLAHHVHRIREELIELATKNHTEATESIDKISGAVDVNTGKLQLHDGRLEILDGRNSALEAGLSEAKAQCGELDLALDAVTARARVNEEGIRDLVYTRDQMSAEIEELHDASQKAKSRLRMSEDGLQAAQNELRSQGASLARTEGELANTISRLDLAHEYWNGFSRGLQDTEQLVSEGKSGMPVQKAKEVPRPRALPALPFTPSASRPHSTAAAGARPESSLEGESKPRPASSQM